MVFKTYLILISYWEKEWKCLGFIILRNIFIKCDSDSFAWQNHICLKRRLSFPLSVMSCPLEGSELLGL